MTDERLKETRKSNKQKNGKIWPIFKFLAAALAPEWDNLAYLKLTLTLTTTV
jgi:hypothetical protein